MFNETSKEKQFAIFSNWINKETPDDSNSINHFWKTKAKKSVKRSKPITQQHKTIENLITDIKSVTTEYLHTSPKLSKTNR